jgi:hypothetical protein
LSIVVVDPLCDNNDMSDTKLIQAVLDEVTKLGQKVDEGFKRVGKKVEENGERIDKLGLQIANLEDDTPTIEELDNLDKRVKSLEKQVVSS